MIKVMLVDDHMMIRRGLKTIIEKNGQIKVSYEAESSEEALKKINKITDLDIVVTDMTMSGMSGIDLTKVLKETHPNLGVLIVSMHKDKEYVLSAINVGAMGYITKDAKAEEIITAITKISQGMMYYSSSLTEILANQITQKSERDSVVDSKNITLREMEVLQLIIKGLSNKEIASKLIVSKRTIDNHRLNLMRKLGAKNTADIVRISFLNHLVTYENT